MKNIKLFFFAFISILSSNEFEIVCKKKLIQKIQDQIQKNNENNQKNLLENNQLNLKLKFYFNENKNNNNFPLKSIFEKNKNNDYFNKNLNNYKKKKLKIFPENGFCLNQKIIYKESNSYDKLPNFFKEKPILINNQNKKFEKVFLTPRYSNNNIIISNKSLVQKQIDEKNWLLIKEKFKKNIENKNIIVTKSIILN